ncbi:MAG: sugar transferase [Actinobacteria bacterium]|nr:sugar transferase [Actinomycetota bacterium]
MGVRVGISAILGSTPSRSFTGAGAVSARPGTAWQRPFVAVLAAGDALALLAGTLVAQAVRFHGIDAAAKEAASRIPYLSLSLLLVPLWVMTLTLCGVYDQRRLGNESEEYRRILNAAVRFLAGVALVALAFNLSVARSMVAIALPLATALSVIHHCGARQWLHRRRAAGRCVHRVLVVGTERQVADLVRHFRRSSHAGLCVVGACVLGSTGTLDVDGDPVPVVGHPQAVITALGRLEADTVAIADHDSLSDGALRQLGWELEGTGTALLVAPSLLDVAGPRIVVHPVAGLPLLHVEEPELTGISRVLKQTIERLAAGVALVGLFPVFGAIALAVWCTSRGPAVFQQRRVGQNGRPFTLYKFRTMRVGAEDECAGLAEQNESDGLLFKIRDDPRRTGVGRLLRRYSIDELPQLWNVLTGHMSLVGPRPPLESEVAGYSPEVRRRLLVKPGLTGLWQVSGRANLPWEEAVRLDLYYVENWSPALDIVILVRTVMAVIRGRGAY